MKNIYYKLSIIFLTAFIVACSSEDDLTEDWIDANEVEVIAPVSGDLDLSNYVAVGNSLTAGFADNALFPDGQANSFPNILAGQFALAGGGSFVNPDIVSGNGNSGGSPASGRLFIDLEEALAALAGDPDASIGNAIVPTAPSAITTSSVTGAGLNNFGVPGARVVDIVTAGYGTLNPFFGAFQTSGTTSVIADAASASPSFFTLWIGSNDVLGYAASGGAFGETFDPFNPATITDQGTFAASLDAVLDAFGNTEGVILNIPPVTIIPYFQIVTELSGGINVLPAGSIDAATAAFLNSVSGYGAYNAGLDALVGVAPGFTQAEADFRKITFSADVANSPVITDESLTDLSGFGLASIRQAQVDPTTGASDLFPLTALDSLGVERIEGNSATTLGVGIPLPDQYTLTMDEQSNVIAAYAGFNMAIAAEADARSNVTLVDVGPLFADMFGLISAQAAGLQLSAAAQAAADGDMGVESGGINLVPLSLSQEELYNSVWSVDGVHPNPRGNALLVNEIIMVLNDTYNATIPEVNPLEFEPINAPF
ncbi:MAG: SGNH/GDSL hydrolase family protein [Ekhidna sp.]|uniref:hypothetical protein n=1 Tax=Ekhidna sp. TaxID=2608089 RepID=UPI0032EED028